MSRHGAPCGAALLVVAAALCAAHRGFHRTMDISRKEQRVLHVLAQGGFIRLLRDDDGQIERIDCYSREGWRLTRFDQFVFAKLRRKRAIASSRGGPYRITRRGLVLVRAQADNR
jgi:hypothetical protein